MDYRKIKEPYTWILNRRGKIPNWKDPPLTKAGLAIFRHPSPPIYIQPNIAQPVLD